MSETNIKILGGTDQMFYTPKPYPIVWLGEKETLRTSGLGRLYIINYYRDGTTLTTDSFIETIARFEEEPEFEQIYIYAGGVKPTLGRLVNYGTLIRGNDNYVREYFSPNIVLVPSGIGAKTNFVVIKDACEVMEFASISKLEGVYLYQPPIHYKWVDGRLVSVNGE